MARKRTEDVIQRRLLTNEVTIRRIKRNTRAKWEERTWCGGCGKGLAKKVKAENGRDLTSEEGRDLYLNRRETTILCSLIALRRGRIHSVDFLRDPSNLIALSEAMVLHQVKEVPQDHGKQQEQIQEGAVFVRAGERNDGQG